MDGVVLAGTVYIKDIISKDEVIKLAKLRKMFMPSVYTRGQQQWKVVKGWGTPGPGQLLMPHSGNAPPAPPHSKCPHTQQQQGTVLAAFVAKIEQLVHGCAFICSLETLEGM